MQTSPQVRLSPLTGIVLAAVLLAGTAAMADSGPTNASPSLRVVSAGDLKTLLGQARGTTTLVHVWATWCPPCREELPSVLRFRAAHTGHGLEVILVSADAPKQRPQIVSYLAQAGVAFSSYLIDNPDAIFIDTLCTNWSGALPASFFFGPKGELRQWWEGKADPEKYEETAEALSKQVRNGGRQ